MLMIVLTMMLSAAQPCAGSTTREVEICLAGELAGADAELNRYYAAAVRRLADERQPAALAKLRESERLWIRHREADCDAVWEYWREGTIRGTCAILCRIRSTRARTLSIWSNWLTFADSSPPMLPRPPSPS